MNDPHANQPLLTTGTLFEYPGSLARTPALLVCSAVERHIPLERVHETADALRPLGARVDERIHPGMAHTVNDDEIVARGKCFNA